MVINLPLKKFEVLLSADSQVVEPADLWHQHLTPAQVEALPAIPRKDFDRHPGGTDPSMRLEAMAADGVSAEALLHDCKKGASVKTSDGKLDNNQGSDHDRSQAQIGQVRTAKKMQLFGRIMRTFRPKVLIGYG